MIKFLLVLSLIGHVTFDYSVGKPGEKACLRLPKGDKAVKTLLYCHQNMTEEVLFRSDSFCRKMDSLGVAMAFIQRGSQNWDPDRTLCIISYHGDAPRTNLCGYGRANVEWGRTRNIDKIPGLMVMGEYEWWDARLLPALAFQMMYPESRISFLCDAGKGHFDLSEETQDYFALFIGKALENPRPEGGVRYSRWFPDGHVSRDVHEQFWYQDKEMVRLAKKRYSATRKKKEQFLGARVNGEQIVYNADSHIKMNARISGETFTVEPFFADSARASASEAHAASRPRVVIISGPVVQTGEYSFKIDHDYFGEDPARLWSGITLCLEADGDSSYKPAVQEINIRYN